MSDYAEMPTGKSESCGNMADYHIKVMPPPVSFEKQGLRVRIALRYYEDAL